MKKFTLFIAAITLLCFSCKETREPMLVFDDPFFTLTEEDGTKITEFDVGAEFYSQTLSVSSNGKWTIAPRETADWITVSPDNGQKDGTVEIKIKANPKEDGRDAILDVHIKGELATSFPVSQEGAGSEMKVSPLNATAPYSGGDVTLTVMGRSEGWEYEIQSIEESNDWLKEKSKGENEVVFTTTKMTNSRVSRKAELKFWIPSDPSVEPKYATVTQNNLTADLLDIQFNNDGTATDISGKNNRIELIAGSPLNVYWNENYQRYTAQFERTTNLGANVGNATGYYKFDYSNNTDFQNGLKDGHTIEVLVMMSKGLPNTTTEIKPFSSHESGGTGVLINSNSAYQGGSTKGNTLQFLPYAGYSGTNTQLWSFPTDFSGGVEPVVGEYYHIVGVYDKTAKKSLTYVDGVLSLSADAAFDLKLSTVLSFYVGGDPTSGATLQASWIGDIAIARIYNDPLSAETVQELWNKVKDGKNTKLLRIPDATISTKAVSGPGGIYPIVGTGFQSGDVIRFESTTSESVKFTCSTAYVAADNLVKATLPSDIVSGTYRIVVVRGTQVYALGVTELTVTGSGGMKRPGIIAHRGYWAPKGDPTANAYEPQNSIAALTRAQGKGFYGSEFDVWKTSDDVLVINHDAAINNITIQTSAYAAIKDQTISGSNSTEKIPTLDAFLTQGALDPNTKLVLEFKTNSNTTASAEDLKTVDLAVQMVADKGLKGQVEYIAFNYEVCKHILTKDPEAMIGYLSSSAVSPATVFADGIKSIDYQYSVYNSNPAYIKQAQDLGMVVNVWTVSDRASMLKFIAAGVDLITTDDPETLQDIYSGLDN